MLIESVIEISQTLLEHSRTLEREFKNLKEDMKTNSEISLRKKRRHENKLGDVCDDNCKKYFNPSEKHADE